MQMQSPKQSLVNRVLPMAIAIFVNFLWADFTVRPAWALPIPPELRVFLENKNKHPLIRSWELIPEISPEEFTREFVATKARYLNSGFGGLAFTGYFVEGNHPGHYRRVRAIYKVSHGIFLNEEPVSNQWGTFRSLPAVIAGLPKVFQHRLPESDRILRNAYNRRSGEKEILGTLIWASYKRGAIKYLPFSATSDGLAYSRRFAAGKTLKELLQELRSPATSPEQAQEKILIENLVWQKVISLQNLSEKMLLETGLGADLLNPENIIVSGSFNNLKLELIDNELLGPSTETIQWYQSQGKQVPAPILGRDFPRFWLPLMPDQLLVTEMWNLTLDQAIRYVSARYHYSTEEQALRHIAATPRWKFEVPKDPFTDHLIREAQERLGLSSSQERHCQEDLTNLSRAQ